MADNVSKVKRGLAPVIRRTKLRYPELSHAQIAKRVGCNKSNVSGVLANFLGDRPESELTDFQENKPAVLEALSLSILESITPSKLAKASAFQLTGMYGIVHDKVAVLRGQATGINVTVLMDVVEAIRSRQSSTSQRSAHDSRTISGT